MNPRSLFEGFWITSLLSSFGSMFSAFQDIVYPAEDLFRLGNQVLVKICLVAFAPERAQTEGSSQEGLVCSLYQFTMLECTKVSSES